MLHFLFRAEHNIANALTEVRLGVSDESDVLNGATVSKLCSKLLLTDNKGQVSDEDASSEILPRVDASVSATSRDCFELALLLVQTSAYGVYSKVLRVEFHLVKLDLGLLSGRGFFVEHVCVLAVLISAVIFQDNFGALGLF